MLPRALWRGVHVTPHPLLALLLLFQPSATAFSAPPGLDAPEPVGGFLDGLLPLGSPGNNETALRVIPAFENLTFNDVTVFTAMPSTDRIVVGSRDGLFESFSNDPQSSTKYPFLDLQDVTAAVWDGGMLALEFHPDFGQSQGKDYAYIYYCAREPEEPYPTGFVQGYFGLHLRLSRFDVDPIAMTADKASELTMINIRMYNASHRGGGMVFDDDGFMWLSIGDQFRYETAQDITDTFEGGILRIDVDMDPLRSHAPRRVMPTHAGEADEFTGVNYWIPDDNPFLDVGSNVFEEFATLGNRNPHRITRDSHTGRLWSGEVGQSNFEEINVLELGRNYGWPFREGTSIGVKPTPPSYEGLLTDPVVDFPHSEANAIIGGYVYHGLQIPELEGRYLCGDYGQDRIWALDYDENTGAATKEYLCQFTPGKLTTFGQALNGEVFLAGLGQDVHIYKLESRVVHGPAPPLLSQTGVFTDMETLETPAWMIPYELNSPFWSDGAKKTHWVVIPNDGTHDTQEETINYDEKAEWEFPEGTVFIEHFELPVDQTDPSITRRLETRMLVSGDAKQYYGITYKWLPDNSDAVLLDDELDEPISIITQQGNTIQTWHYPSRTSCMTCHRPEGKYVLGANTRQLNRDAFYPQTGRTANQLVTLSAIDAIDEELDENDLDELLTSKPLSDSTSSVEHRVRTYLDSNCSFCHRPEAPFASGFDARLTTGLDTQNLVYGDVLNGLGIPGSKVVMPQDSSRSILFQRLDTRIAGLEMPPLGINLEDEAAKDLILQWIGNLDLESVHNIALGKPATQSSTTYGGSPNRAVDGNLDGDYGNGSVTHTDYDLHAWWEIDLGAVYDLDEIALWNRTDCCTNRLSGVHTFVSVDPFESQDLAQTQTQPGMLDLFIVELVWRTQRLPVHAPGRYIRVQLNGQEELTLAEVQVFASTYNGAPVQRYVLGNSPFGDANHDAWTSNLVVNETDAHTNDGTETQQLRVDRFEFSAWQLTDPVTPFVGRRAADNVFTILAIGTTRDATTYQLWSNDFAFDDIAPPVIAVEPGETVVTGFIDALPDGSGGGAGSVIPYDTGGPADEVWITGGPMATDSGQLRIEDEIGPGSIVMAAEFRSYRSRIHLTAIEPIPPTPTGVDPSSLRGRVASLAPPVPNPFNPRVSLRLSLQRSTHVNWGIYDMRGRLVAQLARGLMTAGEHVRQWEGTDGRGRRVASGVYVQRVSTPGEQQSNKLILLK